MDTGVVIASRSLSRGTADVLGAGRTTARAGRPMAGSCALWAAAGWVPATTATLALLAAALVACTP